MLVSDMKRSIRFYRDTLGMELKQESKDWTEFSTRGTVLALHPAKRKRIKRTMACWWGLASVTLTMLLTA